MSFPLVKWTVLKGMTSGLKENSLYLVVYKEPVIIYRGGGEEVG